MQLLFAFKMVESVFLHVAGREAILCHCGILQYGC
jgi:hypothetical protein